MLHASKMLVKSSRKSSHKPHKPFVLDALQCKSFLELRSVTASINSFSWLSLDTTCREYHFFFFSVTNVRLLKKRIHVVQVPYLPFSFPQDVDGILCCRCLPWCLMHVSLWKLQNADTSLLLIYKYSWSK